MKTIKTLFFTLVALLSVQMAQAQCTGSLSFTGTDPSFTFTTTNPNVTAASYFWDFGDGNFSTAPLTASHSYTSNGTFAVICFYSDSMNACSDIDTVYVTVTSQTSSCNASFSTGGNGPTFFFTPNNTPNSPVGYYNFDWSFGDGSYAASYTTNSISHTYTANGTYTVQCILYDSIFCSDTTYSTVTVVNAAPMCDADFIWVDSNGTVLFFPIFPDTSLNYSWSFGDGTSSNLMNPSHQYNPTGSGGYSVCLTISGTSCTDTYCDTVILGTGPGACSAVFAFYDSSNYFTFIPLFPTPGATYSWTTSTGLTSTAENPVFQFATGTTPDVCLVITDSAGTCSDSLCVTIVIAAPSFDISGLVFMGNSAADSGVVFLIEYDSVAGTLTAVDTTFIDSFGTYLFTNVSAGDYLVKAALSPNSTGYSNYLPTYYSYGSPQIPGGALLWSNADYATSPSTWFYPIDLVAGTNPGGPGFVGGLVSQGANKVGDPISDILVIVTDMSGNPVAYEYSDNTGNFNIGNLAYGDYILYPEVYGKNTIPMNFSLSAANNNVNNFRVEVNSTTAAVSIATGITSVQEFSDVVLYPNPVQDELNIDFGKTVAQEITLEMFDVTGRRISIQNVGSTNLVKINTANLNGGVYLIKLSSVDGEQVFKFVK